jgi:hypothetical protein
MLYSWQSIQNKTTMIKSKSDDPDVEQAVDNALGIINDVLAGLPIAETYDYGGHELRLGDYGVCTACTTPIAEAQAAEKALRARADSLEDETVKEHIDLAIRLLHADAEAATMRAEFHNGFGTEQILNRVLGYEYARHIGEDYRHSHHGGQE